MQFEVLVPTYVHISIYGIYRTYDHYVSQLNPERDQSSGTIRNTYIPTYIYISSVTTYRMVPTYIPMVPNPKKGPMNMQDSGFSVF